MSAFDEFTSVVSPKADMIGRLCRRQELMQIPQSLRGREGPLTGQSRRAGLDRSQADLCQQPLFVITSRTRNNAQAGAHRVRPSARALSVLSPAVILGLMTRRSQFRWEKWTGGASDSPSENMSGSNGQRDIIQYPHRRRESAARATFSPFPRAKPDRLLHKRSRWQPCRLPPTNY